MEDVDDENMKVGFNVGLYHHVDVSDNFAIQPEFLFSQKGSEIQFSGFLGGSGR
jgi:hypothetical protein